MTDRTAVPLRDIGPEWWHDGNRQDNVAANQPFGTNGHAHFRQSPALIRRRAAALPATGMARLLRMTRSMPPRARVSDVTAAGAQPLRFLALITVVGPVLAFVAGCNSTPPTTPTPLKCAVALALSQTAMDAAGGAASISVTAAADCAWNVSSSANWISGFQPVSGQGSGQVQFSVAANVGQSARDGDIVVNDVKARLTQSMSPCAISLTPTFQSVFPAGSTGSFHVTTGTGCGWTATSNDSWLKITAGSPGSGEGVVSFAAAANDGTVTRTGTLTIANPMFSQTFTVTQRDPAAQPCVYAISPTSQTAARGGENMTVMIQADPGCSWTAVSNATWLTVVGVNAGVGGGSVTVAASANTGPTRAGTVTIAGQTFTVTQG